MHWPWKNYPVAKAIHYTGRKNKPTIVLYAVVHMYLWIWHAHGGENDIGVRY